jgi:hypothetical protein
MNLALAVFLNYCLQHYFPNLKYWQARYAQLGKNAYSHLLKKPTWAAKINTDGYALFFNLLPYLIYLLIAVYLQNHASAWFDLETFIIKVIFLILGVIHVTIPDVGPEKDDKMVEISNHYFKEIYFKTFLPLSLILMPAGYILLALYFNIRFLLYQNIVYLPTHLEDILEKTIEWVEEKMQLICATIFAIMSHQEDVWQGIRWRYTKYQDFLYQILYHASPMVTKIDFQAMNKSYVYKNTTLILKRSLWAFSILFIVRSFFT